MVFKRIVSRDGDGAAAVPHAALGTAIVDATVVAIDEGAVAVDAEVVVVDAHIVADAPHHISLGAAAEKCAVDGESSTCSGEAESDGDDDGMDAEERAMMAMAIALSQQDAEGAASAADSNAASSAAPKAEEQAARVPASAILPPPPPPPPPPLEAAGQDPGQGHAPQAPHAPLRFALTHEETAQLEREVEQTTNAAACVRNLAYLTGELAQWSSPHWLAAVAFDAQATLTASE